jgi:hypothetical protein
MRTGLAWVLAASVCACGGSHRAVDAGDQGDAGEPCVPDGDEDSDGISDSAEGRAADRDTDGDGTADWRDDDSDGDTLPDLIEAGDADPCAPIDTDGDGAADFVDRDADDDGLSDRQEDRDGDGVLDPGESSPTEADTDGDGALDVFEWVAGTDPQSRSTLDDLYVMTPFGAAERGIDLTHAIELRPTDVLLQLGTTGALGGTIAERQALAVDTIDALALAIPGVAVGSASFQDFPVAPFGSGGDLPFALHQRITTDLGAAASSLDAWASASSGDPFDSGYEAIHQAMTGAGIDWGTGSVPPFDGLEGFDPAWGHGLLGGAGFREDATRVLIHLADAPPHEAIDYAGAVPGAHSRADAVDQLVAAGAKLVAITADPSLRADLEELARDTGSVVAPTAWGGAETLCGTGAGATPRPPDPTGLCPLVFDAGTGADAAAAIVDAIGAVVVGPMRVTCVAAGDPLGLPGFDTSAFVTRILPRSPAPPGAAIDGPAFINVYAGSLVGFDILVRNTFRQDGIEARWFRVILRVFGDEALLGERELFVVVPAVSI